LFFPRIRVLDMNTIQRFDLPVTGYGKHGTPLYSMCYYTKEDPTKLQSLEFGSSNINIDGRRQLVVRLNQMIGFQAPPAYNAFPMGGVNAYNQAVTINVLQQQLSAQTQALANAAAVLQAQQLQQQPQQNPPPYAPQAPISSASDSSGSDSEPSGGKKKHHKHHAPGATKRSPDTPIRGYLVEAVMDGSPAQEAGLQERDVVMEVNGKPATVEVINALVQSLGHSSSNSSTGSGPQPDNPFVPAQQTPDVASVLMLVLDQTTDEQRLVRLVPKPGGGSLGLRWSPYGWASEFA